MNTIKLLLVDDHTMFLEGTQHALSKSNIIDLRGAFTNGKEALKALKSIEIDILVYRYFHAKNQWNRTHKTRQGNTTESENFGC